MPQDLHIFYAGASGGHLCTHLVLLSAQHFCQFENQPLYATKQEFSTAFDCVLGKQWNIDQTQGWKNTEHWPDNCSTHATVIAEAGRLYLTCTTSMLESVYPACKILLYTDIDTQLKLAKFKRAWCYHDSLIDGQRYYDLLNQLWLNSYANAKDSSWPMVDLASFHCLPDWIKAELLTEHSDFSWCADYAIHRDSLKSWLSLKPTGTIQNHTVWKSVQDMQSQVDITVRLQDILRSRGKSLTDALDLPWTQRHEQLIDRWLKLHPADLQHTLLQ